MSALGEIRPRYGKNANDPFWTSSCHSRRGHAVSAIGVIQAPDGFVWSMA